MVHRHNQRFANPLPNPVLLRGDRGQAWLEYLLSDTVLLTAEVTLRNRKIKRAPKLREPFCVAAVIAYGVGITALTWLEYELSVPVLLTAVVT